MFFKLRLAKVHVPVELLPSTLVNVNVGFSKPSIKTPAKSLV